MMNTSFYLNSLKKRCKRKAINADYTGSPGLNKNLLKKKIMDLGNPRYAASKTSSIMGGLLNGLREKEISS